MTALHNIEQLLARLAPGPICDDRMARTLGRSPRKNVDHAACEMLGRDGFERRKDTGSLCAEIRLVTRQR
ncbi:hypothetical protein WSK_3468 [Novosphingobium sp. Rr 2-17]|uniref:hypothetical protein n=1 Tax=Novosphingobium sp. Rr 2-17 TaxID=555793 RepID=UPI0002699F09|nr:hypothetical protein [Novosphingobium sp. Rr 2-17]EIZ77992.1 hypothetical protein WSK_3468 [Novosphingobium sp. Rr 2-17]